MNCPYCKDPLMSGMTICPKCKYDINKHPTGGKEHVLWLLENGFNLSYDQKTIYKGLIEKYDEEHPNLEKKAAEREREEKLIAIEKARQEMILSTCQSVDGYRAVKQLGLVFGECAYKTGFFKSLSASLDNIGDVLSFGDRELSGTARILESARDYAINKMIEAAVQRGANAVLGIDSESSLGGDIMHVTIYGTAVLIEEITKKE